MAYLSSCGRLVRLFVNINRDIYPTISNSIRRISVSSPKLVKEIKVVQEGDITVVDAKIKDSNRKGHLLSVPNQNSACPLCKLNLKLLHTDVLILSQFVDSEGRVLEKSITGLCNKRHWEVVRLVDEAQRAGLMPGFFVEVIGKPDPKERWKWEKRNTYFLTPQELKWKNMDLEESYWYIRHKKRWYKLKDVL